MDPREGLGGNLETKIGNKVTMLGFSRMVRISAALNQRFSAIY